jgi:endonuclease-3 related protein
VKICFLIPGGSKFIRKTGLLIKNYRQKYLSSTKAAQLSLTDEYRGDLMDMFHALYAALGPSRWWPALTPFEVAVGAILTQNTQWSNVEQAIANLRSAEALEPYTMHRMPAEQLSSLIRPSGFFRLKTRRLQQFLLFLRVSCDFQMEKLAQIPLPELRTRLLQINGIGPETADSILLYALKLPTFVVDSYTKRLAARHMLVSENIAYEDLRRFYMDALPHDPDLFNEYHALIVRANKIWCLKKAGNCAACPLQRLLIKS